MNDKTTGCIHEDVSEYSQENWEMVIIIIYKLSCMLKRALETRKRHLLNYSSINTLHQLLRHSFLLLMELSIFSFIDC